MTSIRLKIEESWYASMDCKVQKSGPWVCFYGGHSTGYKLGNHPKNIEPCAHRARTVRAPCDNAPLACCPRLVVPGRVAGHLVDSKFSVPLLSKGHMAINADLLAPGRIVFYLRPQGAMCLPLLWASRPS